MCNPLYHVNVCWTLVTTARKLRLQLYIHRDVCINLILVGSGYISLRPVEINLKQSHSITKVQCELHATEIKVARFSIRNCVGISDSNLLQLNNYTEQCIDKPCQQQQHSRGTCLESFVKHDVNWVSSGIHQNTQISSFSNTFSLISYYQVTMLLREILITISPQCIW